MKRDYQIDPQDPGVFVPAHELQELDKSTERGITKLDKPKAYPTFKFFVQVVGGWRGFHKKVNARRFYKLD